MNQTGKTLLLLGAFGLSFSVQALTPDTRYDTIIVRNIFRLNPPPPPAAATNLSPELSREVKLSGISNVSGNKKAWFIVPTKPGSKDLPLYLSLSEGEAQDFLEVVSISEEEGEVKILHTKNPMTLSLKTDTLKPSPVAPLAPSVPVANVITPNVVTPQPSTVAASYANPANPVAPYGERTATVTGGTPTLPTATAQTDGGLRQIPTRTLRLAPVPTPAAPEKPIDPLTQRVLMEVQQEQATQTGQKLPPLPPLP